MAGLSSTACVTVAYRGKAGLLPANHRSANIGPQTPFTPTKTQPNWGVGDTPRIRGGQELTCDTPLPARLLGGEETRAATNYVSA